METKIKLEPNENLDEFIKTEISLDDYQITGNDGDKDELAWKYNGDLHYCHKFHMVYKCEEETTSVKENALNSSSNKEERPKTPKGKSDQETSSYNLKSIKSENGETSSDFPKMITSENQKTSSDIPKSIASENQKTPSNFPKSTSSESQETTSTNLDDNTKKYTCGHCRVTFSAQHILRRHEKTFKDIKNDCNICHKKLCTLQQLKQHQDKIHRRKREETKNFVPDESEDNEESGFQCDRCGLKYSEKNNFRVHMFKHQDEDSGSLFICNICYNVFKNRYALQGHILRTHGEEEKHVCNICNLRYKWLKNLNTHLQIHQSKILYECPQCGGAFRSLHLLNMHRKKKHRKEFLEHENNTAALTNGTVILSKNRKPSYKCKICGKELKNLLYLKEHVSRHNGEPLYTCPICHLRFYSCSTWYRHKRRSHRQESEAGELRNEELDTSKLPNATSYCICKKCGMRVENFLALIIHTKEVHNEYIHDCKFCKKSFKRTENLIKHIDTHSAYDCSFQSTTEDKPNTSGKPTNNASLEHFCNECDFIANSRLALITHEKNAHIPKELNECRICKKTFKTKQSYRDHMSVHKGVPLYKCAYCSEKFFNYSKFNSHRRRKHPEELLAEKNERLIVKIKLPEPKITTVGEESLRNDGRNCIEVRSEFE